MDETKFEKGFYVNTLDPTQGDSDIMVREKGLFKPVSMTGDVTINNKGKTTIENQKIIDSMINKNANIQVSKTLLRAGRLLDLSNNVMTNTLKFGTGLDFSFIPSILLSKRDW